MTYWIGPTVKLLWRIMPRVEYFLDLSPVWPDWAIYWTLGNFSKPLATINLPKSPKLLGIFVKVSKSLIFRVKSFLGNSYRHSAIFSGHTGFNINRAAFCLGRYSLHLLLLNISMTCLRKDQMKYFLIQCIGLKKKKIRHVLIQKYG